MEQSYSYLRELNDIQRSAVENIDGASMVIAGAGSGKTRVLTFKIAHMLNLGIQPHSIIALTFTNKAAREMKLRISKIIGENTAKYLWMGTFHSIFAKILRFEAETINYPSSFSIYDTLDSKNLIKTIVKELKLDSKVYKEAGILSRISFAKNNLISAQAYASNSRIRQIDSYGSRPEIYRIYKIYETRCQAAGAMDFDDILMKTNQLFNSSEKILEKYQDKFQYILVDEYQDTNYSQYMIIHKLAMKHNNICVVGDDAQSIYAFRGARIENMLNFKNDYPNTRIFKLEQNYRSTQNIVNAANNLIKKNKNQIPKNIFSVKSLGSKINISQAFTDTEEAYIIANSISDLHFREHVNLSDFAILYRTNSQSRTLEDALRKKNIAYKIFGGISFYQRKEIKDLVAYFRLIINHHDDEAFKRIINYPKRGIGATTITRLSNFATYSGISIWRAAEKIADLDIKISKTSKNKILEFLQMIENFKLDVINEDAYETAKEIASKSGILKDLHVDKSPEGISRYENIQELLNGIKDYTTRQQSGETPLSLVDFVENVSLLTNEDNSSDEHQETVSLMTVHSAKGLEFKHVFIAGMEEDLFPSAYSKDSIQDLEEERRLFYVAITRAEEHLTISYAKKRYKWGKLANCVQSRFIKELNPKFIEYGDKYNYGLRSKNTFFENKKSKPKLTIIDNSNSSKLSDNKKTTIAGNNFRPVRKASARSTYVGNRNPDTQIKVGSFVRHEMFGKGKVIDIDGVEPNTKVRIKFDRSGTKTLLLRFAKLKVI